MSLLFFLLRDDYILAAADRRSTTYEQPANSIVKYSDNYQKIMPIGDKVICSCGDNSFNGEQFQEFIQRLDCESTYDILHEASRRIQGFSLSTTIFVCEYTKHGPLLSALLKDRSIVQYTALNSTIHAGDDLAAAVSAHFRVPSMKQDDATSIKAMYDAFEDLYKHLGKHPVVGPLADLYRIDKEGVHAIDLKKLDA